MRDVGDILIVGFITTVALLTVLASGLLLIRRTARTGLRLHFSLANLWLLTAIIFLLMMAWEKPDHRLQSNDLNFGYFLAAISGIWFATGLTLQALLKRDAANP